MLVAWHLALCFALHGLVITVAFSSPRVLSQHQWMCLLHGHLSLSEPWLMGIPVVAWFVVAPIQYFGHMMFHNDVNFLRSQPVVGGLAVSIASLALHRMTEQRLHRTFDLLSEREVAQVRLRARHIALQKMRDSLFDASCVCDRNHHNTTQHINREYL